MSVQYVNRKGKTYYLHQSTTKTGKPKYFFSKKCEGVLVDIIPDRFEIYENPNARVFLRRILPRIITDDEIAVVEKGMKLFSRLQYYQVDVKKDTISVFVADQDVDRLSDILRFTPGSRGENVQDLLALFISYSPMLRFVLIDKERRIFVAKRYCFLGSIDDLIEISETDTLQNLVKTYVKHLGRDSYYDLF